MMLRTSVSLTLLAALCQAQSPSKEKAGRPQPDLPVLYQSIVITASPVQPSLERRNEEVFRQTLFSRDDQLFHLLAAGIDAGQHEGGGKSIEVRRFGFNLDHGGVNGGLKVLIDNVQQNQGTQGHGQGYLGSLKSVSPELVEEVSIINGPFSAEYGDFSGLGVVHIRFRESLPDVWTARVQGGSFNTQRGFLAFSPELRDAESFIAYEGSRTDGPFLKPLGYRRDNVTGNYRRRLSERRSVGLKWNGGRNDFYSSGQLPLDLVYGGRLDRFASLDPGDGGRVRTGTVGLYYRADTAGGGVWKLDGFMSRSLFDLYSNFTFFLNDPVNGDGIQQHDSRLQEGANLQYTQPHTWAGASGMLTAGGNFHANQINVGMYPRINRTPLGITLRAHAAVTNGAGYVQEVFSLLNNRLQVGGGLRYDLFSFDLNDKVDPAGSMTRQQGNLQPKANIAFTPSRSVPATLYFNYGRGISSLDARGIVEAPRGDLLATTDFYQVGTSHQFGRYAFTTDLFWIDRSNELVYIPDDGSLEFAGPSRAYGFEAKASIGITRKLALEGGLTKVLNSYYRGTDPREYIERAPHFVANGALTVAGWHGWSGSLRLRAINHYRLDPLDPTISAAGHTVLDLSASRRIRRGVEFNIAIDNLTDRAYFETQNYFESRLKDGPPTERIHGTPGYPISVMVGLTFRFRGKQ